MTRFTSLPTRLLPNSASHSRRSANLIASGTTFPFNASMSVSFATPGLVLLQCTGITADVNVDLVGDLNGSGDTETVVVPASGSLVARSSKRWSTITTIRVDETQSGSIEATAVAVGGAPVFTTTVLDAALKVRLVPKRLAPTDVDEQGRQIIQRFVLFTNSSSVAVGDQFVINGITYEAEHVNAVWGQGGAAHHSEVHIRRTS